jgi:hypothetical protein
LAHFHASLQKRTAGGDTGATVSASKIQNQKSKIVAVGTGEREKN